MYIVKKIILTHDRLSTVHLVKDDEDSLTRYEVVITPTGGSATAVFSRANSVRNATRPFCNVRKQVQPGPTLDKLLTAARAAVARAQQN